MPRSGSSKLYSWLFESWQCSCTNCETDGYGAEDVQVQLLSTDLQPGQQRHHQQHMLARKDSFDITFTPRSLDPKESSQAHAPVTPRQRDLHGQLELPILQSYPVPPCCSTDEEEHEQRQKLLEMYQDFALDLHRGMYLTQLMADRSYSDIHCQLMEDMSTLKLDQSNGRIIEFPLANVSKVYRLTKNAGKWYPAEKQHSPPTDTEQIIVVVFSKRKLAFVFKDMIACHRFMLCLELLVWRAQQLEGLPLLKASPSSKVLADKHGVGNEAVRDRAFSQTPALSGPCPTPRLVRDSEGPKPHAGDWKASHEDDGLPMMSPRFSDGLPAPAEEASAPQAHVVAVGRQPEQPRAVVEQVWSPAAFPTPRGDSPLITSEEGEAAEASEDSAQLALAAEGAEASETAETTEAAAVQHNIKEAPPGGKAVEACEPESSEPAEVCVLQEEPTVLI